MTSSTRTSFSQGLPSLRRIRCLVAALAVAATVTACGSQQATGGGSASSLEGVTFSGGVGKAVTAKWRHPVKARKSTSYTTLVKGSGDKIATGDQVSTYIWIGDATTKKTTYSDYTHGAPETIPVSTKLSPFLQKLFANKTYGTRVAAVTTPAGLLGSSSAASQLGVGTKDTLVVVADLVKKAPQSPTPSNSKAHIARPSSMPKVLTNGGKPAGFDWKGITKPSLSTPVQRVVLKRGHGATVKSTDTVTVNYLGETYHATKPFDASYSRSAFTQKLTSLIPGWRIGLTGVKVGSRVLLQIPPAYAYGVQGSGSTIPGNSTLWFVIDILKTK